MKKFMLVSMFVFVAFVMACASNPPASNGNGGAVADGQRGEDVPGFLPGEKDIMDLPCFEPDAGTDFFSCTQIAVVTAARSGDAITTIREKARTDCAGKVFDSVKGLAKRYVNDYGNNKGDDLSSKVEQGFKDAIAAIMRNTKDACLKVSTSVDQQNRGTIYLQLKFYQKDLAEAMTAQATKMVPDSERKLIDVMAANMQEEIEKEFGERKARTAAEEEEHIRNTTTY